MISSTPPLTLQMDTPEWSFPRLFPEVDFVLIDRAVSPDHWECVLGQQADKGVGYQRELIRFHHHYFASIFPRYQKLDCLIYWRQQIVGLWPLAVFGNAEETRISSHFNGAHGIIPPLFIPTLTDKQTRGLTQAWLAVVAALCQQATPRPDALRFLSPTPWLLTPDWYRRLQRDGAHWVSRHRLVADLTLTAVAYRQQIRKSYKSLINNAEKLWHTRLDDRGDAAAFAQFQQFHEQVAGRRTRPTESWNCQLQTIRDGFAFAIYLYDPAEKLVGASYYTTSGDEVCYGVGAYDRALFDQPIAHLSLYRAIEHCRAAGHRRMILGDRPFPADHPAPNQKELQIAFFKEGFATELQILPALEISAARLAAPAEALTENAP